MRPAATVMTKIALAGIGLPVILVLLCYLSLSSGGADHNRAAVHLAFDGGDIPNASRLSGIYPSNEEEF